MAGRQPALAARRLARLEPRHRRSRPTTALALTGITESADVQAGLLPTGQRRLVELARALAGPFDVLLLDEPSSGLDQARDRALRRRCSHAVVRERGCGILLVEHDMTLVRGVCEHIYVLDFGTLIFEGTPEEVARQRRRPGRVPRRRVPTEPLDGAVARRHGRRGRDRGGAVLRSSTSPPATATRPCCATSDLGAATWRGGRAARSERGRQDDRAPHGDRVVRPRPEVSSSSGDDHHGRPARTSSCGAACATSPRAAGSSRRSRSSENLTLQARGSYPPRRRARRRPTLFPVLGSRD